MLAFMALFLTACGEKQEERSKLIMVTNATFPPYEFYQGERIVGIDADMVREIARRFNLPNAEKKDSQGICFIGQVKMSDFLRHYLPDNPGDIVDLSKLPSGATDTLRIVRVGDYDACACAGDHVANTSEIGPFTILSHSYADGVWRVRWKVVEA